ncbi:hypothetical protein D3C84_630600 [compost metagenome]
MQPGLAFEQATAQWEAYAQVVDLQHRFAFVPWQGFTFGFRIQQHAAVGVLRCIEQALAIGLFDDLAGAHHAHPLRDAAHQVQVVTDQQQRHAQALLQRFEQQQDLALHGHVQRGGRLVGDQQLGLASQGHGDHHPLSLAARELVRVGLEAFFGFLDAYQVQQFENALMRRLAPQSLVHQQGLADLFFDAVQRIEGGHRLLEDHRDAIAPQRAQGAAVGAHQFLATVANTAGRLGAALGQQLQDRVGGHRLARAGLAHQRQALAGTDVQAQVAHRRLTTEGHVEVTDFDQVVAHINSPLRNGGSRSRIKIVDQDRGSRSRIKIVDQTHRAMPRR